MERERRDRNRGWACGPWGTDADFGPFAFRLRPWRRGRSCRVFEQGDLKLVILQLLEEKPRHGYEIIKELEERSGGRYAPSPGTVYPTLTMLEDMGYAAGAPEPTGRKVYSITDEGRNYLAQHRTTVDDVFDRLSELGASIFGDAVRPAHEAMARLGRAYWRATMRQPLSNETIAKAAEIVTRAASELEALVAPR